MFRGGATNPYDEIVAKTTDENLTSENWELILNLCDKVQDEGEPGARNVIAALLKRLAHRNPNVQLYALALAEALSKNCGVELHREIASRSFTQGLERLIMDRTTHDKVKKKALALIASWTSEFSSDPTLGIMEECYNNLKSKNYKFEPVNEAPPPAVDDEARRKEEEELQRVLEMSLHDKGGRNQWGGYAPSSSSAIAAGSSSSASGPSSSRKPAAATPAAAASSSSRPKQQHTPPPAAAPAAASSSRPSPAYHSPPSSRANLPAASSTHHAPAPAAAAASSPAPAPQRKQSNHEPTPAAAPALPAASPGSPSVPSTTALPAPKVTRVRALHAFEPTEQGELAFEKGDIIKVVDRGYKDWWRGQLKGRTGIFPVNYVEVLPEQTAMDIAREAEQEASVFAGAGNIDKLLTMLKDIDPQKDNLADNEEIQELYRSSMALRPKIVKLIDRYSQKKLELQQMNESFVKARKLFDDMMEESLAKHNPGALVYDQRQRSHSPGRGGEYGQPYGWPAGTYGPYPPQGYPDQYGQAGYPGVDPAYYAQQQPGYDPTAYVQPYPPQHDPNAAYAGQQQPPYDPNAYAAHQQPPQGYDPAQYPGYGQPQPSGQDPNAAYPGYPQAPGQQPQPGQDPNAAYPGYAQGQAPQPQPGQDPNAAYAGAPGYGQPPAQGQQPQAGQDPNAAYPGYAQGQAPQPQPGQDPNAAYPGYAQGQAPQPQPGQDPNAAYAGAPGYAQQPGQQPQQPQQDPTAAYAQQMQAQQQQQLQNSGADPNAHAQAQPQPDAHLPGYGQQQPQPGAADPQAQAQAQGQYPAQQQGQAQPASQGQDQQQQQAGDEQPPPIIPVAYDPNGQYADPNVMAWAQYYAAGGTDLAGSVYFISVPGVTGPPAPAAGATPGQEAQPQAQPAAGDPHAQAQGQPQQQYHHGYTPVQLHDAPVPTIAEPTPTGATPGAQQHPSPGGDPAHSPVGGLPGYGYQSQPHSAGGYNPAASPVHSPGGGQRQLGHQSPPPGGHPAGADHALPALPGQGQPAAAPA